MEFEESNYSKCQYCRSYIYGVGHECGAPDIKPGSKVEVAVGMYCDVREEILKALIRIAIALENKAGS